MASPATDGPRTPSHDGGCGDAAMADGVPDPDFDAPLPRPSGPVASLRFGRDDLGAVRRFVESEGTRAGLPPARVADLVLAADEIAVNSVTHGGSGGTVRCWTDSDNLVCELAGGGSITDPLAGRVRPAPERPDGRGLWLANQLCDLVQIRNTGGGLVVRLRVRTAA